MIIFCAGLRSSASTLQWQIASAVVGEHGFIVPRANQISRHSNTDKIAVAKQHKLTFADYIKNSDAKILMTVRDLRDVQASLMLRWGKPFEYCFDKLKLFVKQQSEWMIFPEKTYLSYYEQWTSNLAQEIHNIANFLGITDYSATEIADRYSLENNRDRLGKRHLTDGAIGKYKDVLTTKQIQQIENTFHDWLYKYNYLE